MDRILPALGMVLVILGFGAFAVAVITAGLVTRWSATRFTQLMVATGAAGLVLATVGFWIRRRTDPLR
jgi:hypothetical protein